MTADGRQSRIRNFCIVAHIDHGKSTLADRLLESTGALSEPREEGPVPRQHGSRARARHHHQGPDGAACTRPRPPTARPTILNLIDTPGHVDFSYEVSRALQACEGAVLVVDAAQGIEAQTLANAYLAVDADLEILPVVNKIDLPSADPDQGRAGDRGRGRARRGRRACGVGEDGTGDQELLQQIVDRRCRRPTGDEEASTRALVFDAWFDSYVGAVMLVR